jgi:ribosomal protein L40E
MTKKKVVKKSRVLPKKAAKRKPLALKSEIISTKTAKVCSDCGYINKMSLEFCEKCGGTLREENLPVCPKCSSVNSDSAVKCFYCGEILKTGIKSRKPAIEKTRKKGGIEYFVESPKELPPARTTGRVTLEASDIIKKTLGAYVENLPIFLLWGSLYGLIILVGIFYGMARAPMWLQIVYYAFSCLITAMSYVLMFITFSMIQKGVKTGIGQIGDIFDQSFNKFFIYIWVMILYILVCAGGTILLIVPGIIFTYRYYFAGIMSVLDTEPGNKYMEKSHAMTEGYKMDIFICAFLSGLATIPVEIVIAGITALIYLMAGLPLKWETVGNTAGVFFNILIAPYSVGITYFMYKKLRN